MDADYPSFPYWADTWICDRCGKQAAVNLYNFKLCESCALDLLWARQQDYWREEERAKPKLIVP